MKKILLILSLGLLLSSCGSSKKTVDKPIVNKPVVKTKKTEVLIVDDKESNTVLETKKSYSTLEYINTYSEIAKSEMKNHKIPASITIAQGILESNNGNGVLTRKSNNHFGIKCHRGWRGEKVYHDDDEKGECFRSYSDPATSFKDHSIFLSKRKRYADLFKLEQNDYKSWAKGLRQAGYATDKKYPEKLIKIIEKYKLYELDNDVLLNEKYKNVVTHTVTKGETLFGISRKYRIKIKEIKKINKLENDDIKDGQILVIKAKPIALLIDNYSL
jgi:flagellum-specific peptidoglycan hydrolase FlgJ